MTPPLEFTAKPVGLSGRSVTTGVGLLSRVGWMETTMWSWLRITNTKSYTCQLLEDVTSWFFLLMDVKSLMQPFLYMHLMVDPSTNDFKLHLTFHLLTTANDALKGLSTLTNFWLSNFTAHWPERIGSGVSLAFSWQNCFSSSARLTSAFFTGSRHFVSCSIISLSSRARSLACVHTISSLAECSRHCWVYSTAVCTSTQAADTLFS